MKRRLSFLCALALAPSLFAQTDPYELAAVDTAGEQEEAWILSAAPQAGIFTFIHSALQRRADASYASAEDFRDNEADGEGYGIVLKAQKGPGALVIDYLRSDVKYERRIPAGGSRINTSRTDLDILWRQTTGQNDNGHWGWHAGVRWLGESNDLAILEKGKILRENEEVNWMFLKTGYYGELTPWSGQVITAHGNVNLLIGEVEGLARASGNDVDAGDGKIEETYDRDFSLAYGASALMGLTLHVTDQVNVSVDYRREWLYSFEATGTGIVVFPDNDDAKFINLNHGVFISLTYIW
jgi:hypothetical protein